MQISDVTNFSYSNDTIIHEYHMCATSSYNYLSHFNIVILESFGNIN